MVDWVCKSGVKIVVLLIECFMSDNVMVEVLEVNFVCLCNFCLYMKKIMLENIYDCLKFGQYEVEVEDIVIEGVCVVVQVMFDLFKFVVLVSFDLSKQEKLVELVMI